MRRAPPPERPPPRRASQLKRPLSRRQATSHWALLAGFAERETETYALVLDTSAPKMGCHWLPLRVLAACMWTKTLEGASRGYLRVGGPFIPISEFASLS